LQKGAEHGKGKAYSGDSAQGSARKKDGLRPPAALSRVAPAGQAQAGGIARPVGVPPWRDWRLWNRTKPIVRTASLAKGAHLRSTHLENRERRYVVATQGTGVILRRVAWSLYKSNGGSRAAEKAGLRTRDVTPRHGEDMEDVLRSHILRRVTDVRPAMRGFETVGRRGGPGTRRTALRAQQRNQAHLARERGG